MNASDDRYILMPNYIRQIPKINFSMNGSVCVICMVYIRISEDLFGPQEEDKLITNFPLQYDYDNALLIRLFRVIWYFVL